MKGRTNMPLEAVLALVHMVKARQQELRNHTKLDVSNGWTVRNQTWHEITTELNIRYGRELTVDQCMKKLLNIKSMTRYKLEDQERKRTRPGMENYIVKLTPAEREYILLFYRNAAPNPPVPGAAAWEHIQMLLGGGDLRMSTFEEGHSAEGTAADTLLKDELLGGGEDEVFELGDDEAEDNLPDERPPHNESKLAQTSSAWRGPRHTMPNACNGRIWTDATDGTFISMRTNHSCREGREEMDGTESREDGNGTPPMAQSATAIFKVEMGDSLTNAILGILPQQSADDAEADGSASERIHSAEHQQHHIIDQQQQVPPSATDVTSMGGSAIGSELRRHSLLGPIPIRLQQQQSVEGQQSGIGQSMLRNVRNTNLTQNHSQQSNAKKQFPPLSTNCHSDQHLASRKRRLLHSQQQSSSSSLLPLNGFDHNGAVGDVETVELRLKRLKCELIEKQLMELGHQEEWRLKQEFLLGRQTAAMENIVIQLRQIKDKLK